MVYLYPLSLLLLFTILGEFLRFLLPFPIPASIYGLVLLFLALTKKWVKLENIEKTADFFIGLMPIMFVPPLVGLIEKFTVIRPLWLVLLFMIFLSTIAVMAGSGFIANWLMIRKERK